MADWINPLRLGILACYYEDDPPVNMTRKARLLTQLNDCDNSGAKKVPPTYPNPLFVVVVVVVLVVVVVVVVVKVLPPSTVSLSSYSLPTVSYSSSSSTSLQLKKRLVKEQMASKQQPKLSILGSSVTMLSADELSSYPTADLKKVLRSLGPKAEWSLRQSKRLVQKLWQEKAVRLLGLCHQNIPNSSSTHVISCLLIIFVLCSAFHGFSLHVVSGREC